ncbi:ankyrin repeats (3 copies) domain-containing protein [Ditylenchus destructor]|nr:ankyrin repeats (3 copies) domain-containing protein [Ditylenchus destructor]
MIEDHKTHHDLEKFLKGEGKGVDINEKIDGETALHVAVLKRDDADVVECLLKHKADKDAMDDYGRTPLMIAVTQNGHTNIVKLLLNHGVDYVNARSFTGLPMLHFAAMSGNAGMIEALLEYEAKTNKTPSINTPARYQRAMWVIGFPVQWAVYDGRVEAVKVLLKYDHDALKKIKQDEFYEDGSTLLLLAAVMGQVEVVKVLVEKYGANVELKGKPPVGKTSVWNNTPVKIAEGTKNSPRHKETVQYLEGKIKEKQGKKGAQ